VAGHSTLEERELRMALVMTGGVSLAVWMGGVSAEIYRAVKQDGPYEDLSRSPRRAWPSTSSPARAPAV
jgi:hypothetical protein